MSYLLCASAATAARRRKVGAELRSVVKGWDKYCTLLTSTLLPNHVTVGMVITLETNDVFDIIADGAQ